MIFNVGDLVTRKSYNHDILFRIIKIDNDTVYLKGVELRLLADAPINDIILSNNKRINEHNVSEINVLDRNDDFFYLPGKILHIDGDSEYLQKCLKFYKENNVFAIGKKIKEEDISQQIFNLLTLYRPDIVVITGHDAFYKKGKDYNNLKNYKNSINFIKAIKEARKYERSHEKLVIIAGACQSNYEELIKAGANYASSPKRINIHALDPAIIATSISKTERNKEIDLVKLLEKTKYGKEGMGGIMGNGLMYVGFPK